MHFIGLIRLFVNTFCVEKRKQTARRVSEALQIHGELNKSLFHQMKRVFRRALVHLRHPDGYFGRRGKYRDIKLFVFEGYEIVSQSYQAYQISRISIQTWPPLLCAATIAFGCITTGTLYFIASTSHPLHRRTQVFCIEIICDICISMLIPVISIVKPFMNLMQDPVSIFKVPVLMELITAGRIALISSPFSLVFRCTALFVVHKLLTEMEANWIELKFSLEANWIELKFSTKNVKYNKPTDSGKLKLWRPVQLIFKGILILFGVAVGAIGLQAHSNTPCTNSLGQLLCPISSRPWGAATGHCSCLYVRFDCNLIRKQLQWSREQMFNEFNTNFTRHFDKHALAITVLHCPFPTLPVVLEDLTKVSVFRVRDGMMTNWTLRTDKWSDLSSFTLEDVPIQTFPTNLPRGLVSLTLLQTQISSIPAHVGAETFPLLRFLRLEFTPELQAFPSEFTTLQTLEHLYLSNNSIPMIPKNISLLQSLQQLRLSGNQLQYIPEEILSLKQLTRVHLDGNNIIQVPWTPAQIKQGNENPATSDLRDFDFKEILLADNPICANLTAGPHACKRPCKIGCSDIIYNFPICQRSCNFSECYFHRGLCIGY